MKIKCYSVRLKSLTRISDKCFRATSFDGSEGFIPSSQYFGIDYDVSRSDAFWISEWILEKKNIQYSTKKEAYFDSHTRERVNHIEIIRHTPAKVAPVDDNAIASLER